MKYFYYIALLFFVPLLPSQQEAGVHSAVQSLYLPSLAITLNAVNMYVPTDSTTYYAEDIERWGGGLVFVKESDKAFNATRLVVLGTPESIEETILSNEDLLKKRDYSFLKKPCISCISLKALTSCVPQHNKASSSNRKLLQKPLLQEMPSVASSDQKKSNS